MPNLLRNSLGLLLDLVCTAFAALVIYVLFTGGGVVQVASVRISARSVDNPILFAWICFAARSWLSPEFGYFGVARWTPLRLGTAAEHLLKRLRASFEAMGRRRLVIGVLTTIALAVAIRLLLGAVYFGFVYGDEVEVQQLALSRLIGFDYRAWDLRNTSYPLVFVYPMQWLWHAFGARDPGTLVYAGRVCVTLFSALSLWLVFLAVRREARIPALALIAVAIFALETNAMFFGSTVLPRTVTSTFVLVAYLCLGQKGALSVFLSGLTLGVAAALRFSEVIFIVPAAADLLVRRRGSALLPLAAGFLLSCGTILAVSDTIYWGRPFASLESFARYTLLEGKSTHGYQPPWYYAIRVGSWVNAVAFALAVVGAWLHRSRAILWALIPVLLLSLLPHKESRYVLPVLPFVAMLAAAGAWSMLDGISSGRWSARLGRRSVLLASITLGVVAAWLVLNVAGYRSPRSEDSVRAARYIGEVVPPGIVLFEWGHRAGGGIYLSDCEGWEMMGPLHDVARDELTRMLVRTELGCVALRSRTLERFGGESALGELGWIRAGGPPMRNESVVHVFVRSK